VVLNIVEGHSRNNKKEFRVFLRYALGSLSEVEYLLIFASKRKYISKIELDKISETRDMCGRVLWKLMQSQK
jgi:four helix bundle protein